MSPLRTLLSALLMVGALAGCAAASAAAAPQVPRPSRSFHAKVDSLSIAHSAAATRKYRLGIDVDFYTYTGENVAQYVQPDIRYVKSLHANALSVSFPFFVSGPGSNSVYGTAATPSPAELGLLARNAKRSGLYFSIRPLMDQTSIKKSRTAYRPPNLAKWFASYERFLQPYAKMAQSNGIPEFVTGTEFDQFSGSSYWAKLDTYLRKYYHGTLAYSQNWNVPIAAVKNASGVIQMDDAYPGLKLPDNATVTRLTGAWDHYLRTRPHGIVLSEVGIAAQSGAYYAPYNVIWNGKPLRPTIQVHWFDAACNAVANEHEAGIYFWSLGLGQQLNVPPGPADPASWVDGPGQNAISACFKRLG